MAEARAYDVALSFAGEDRDYVRSVATALQSNGINVFFDENEQVEMWGKDLYEHLHAIYSSKATYCVIFISEAYARKVWTRHERRSAQERALKEKGEYILPARFDSTELPGLPSTIAYIDIGDRSPSEFASLILSKLGRAQPTLIEDSEPTFRVPRRTAASFNPYEEAERLVTFLRKELRRRGPSLERANASLCDFTRGDRTCFRVTRGETVLFSLDVWMGGIAGDKGLSFYAVDGEIRLLSNSINAWANLVWDDESERAIVELHDLSLLGHLPDTERRLSFEAFADRMWDRVVDAVDRAR